MLVRDKRNKSQRMNILNKPLTFINEVKLELGKVAWSSRQELIGATLVVIVITAMMAIYIGTVDLILSKILSVVFK